MSSVVDAWISAYLRRLWVGEFLRWAADVFAASCMAFGLCVLSVRLFMPGLWPAVLWLAIGVLPAAGIAWHMTRKHRWTRFDAIVRLDHAVKAQGLIMTIYERTPGENSNDAWTERFADYESRWRQALPRIRPKRFAGYLALPVLFAVAVCFVPLRHTAQGSLERNSLSRKTTRELAELVEQMQKQNLLEDPKEELRVKAEIQKLAEDTQQKPLTHEQWEAVDAVQERLSLRINAANTAISKASNAAAQLQAANEAAELLQNNDDAQTVESSKKRLDEAYDALERSMGTPGILAAKKGTLQKLCQSGSKSGHAKLRQPLSKEESDELDDLKEYLNEEQKKLNELKKQCKCKGNGVCDGNEISDGDEKPGQGSISRGRGDAELTWGKEPDSNGFKFKEIVLPEQDVDAPNEAIVKVERAAPVVDPAAAAPRSGIRQLDAAAGVSTWSRKLSPRHRNIVQKYFDGH